jgi:formylglycine-generating enzyme required for sulfatase activity
MLNLIKHPLLKNIACPLLALLFLSCSSSNDPSRIVSRDGDTVKGETSITASMDTLRVRIPGSSVIFRMVPMPGGEMMLGSSVSEVGHQADEGPTVRVRVSPFWIQDTELSFDAYALFRFAEKDTDSTSVDGKRLPVDAVARPSTPYEDPSFGMDGPGYPAVGMTQWGALQFARWLSEKTGRFFRLPTEAEWEYACLGGDDSQPPFGISSETVDSYAWYEKNASNHLNTIATRRPNAAGIYDMNGNVAEWTLDQYEEGYYRSLSDSVRMPVDPWRVPERLHPRTVRGGNFTSSAEELRCARREESSMRWKRRDPQIPKSFWWNTDSPFVGFRLVIPANPPTPDEQESFWRLVLGE